MLMTWTVPLMEGPPAGTKPGGTSAFRLPVTGSDPTAAGDGIPLKVTPAVAPAGGGTAGSAVRPDPVMIACAPDRRMDGNTPVIFGWVRVAAFLPTYNAAETLVRPSSVAGMTGRPRGLGRTNS